MKNFSLGTYALHGGVALALLAGCGGSQLQLAPGAMSQTSVIAPGHLTLDRSEPSSPSFNLLYTFPRAHAGFFPAAALLNVKGMLYGTTRYGGLAGKEYFLKGLVYRTSTTGATEVLHRFRGGADGANPTAGLINVNGTLYGTTLFGGGTGCYAGTGCGTVYSISTRGKVKILYSFTGGADGGNPMAGLIDVNGTLYGTTEYGGGAGCSTNSGCGTVYSISTTGVEKVLHRFGYDHHGFNYNDGANPVASLIDVKGKLYGTTSFGGGLKCLDVGCGTVYSISMAGAEKVLYSFAGDSDGAQPRAALIDVRGTLYGTTAHGGSSSGNNGTVYSVSTSGTERVLYRFAPGGGCAEGTEPLAPLINFKGALYGTTASCGGSVYSITTTGTQKVLHQFTGRQGGESPRAPLIVMNDTLYGTTTAGGGDKCHNEGCGTIFTLSL